MTVKAKDLIINEELRAAERAFSAATADNVVELCQKYLDQLNKYRDSLFDLRGVPEIDLKESAALGPQVIEETRDMVRRALEYTVEKRNQTEALLKSFTLISGYEAAHTLNSMKYRGFDSWEMHSGGARLKYVYADKGLSMQETIEIASLLRRKAYVDNKNALPVTA